MSLGRLFNRLRLNFCDINSLCFIYIYIYIYIKLSETFYLQIKVNKSSNTSCSLYYNIHLKDKQIHLYINI